MINENIKENIEMVAIGLIMKKKNNNSIFKLFAIFYRLCKVKEKAIDSLIVYYI